MGREAGAGIERAAPHGVWVTGRFVRAESGCFGVKLAKGQTHVSVEKKHRWRQELPQQMQFCGEGVCAFAPRVCPLVRVRLIQL